ncbi:Protein BUD31 like protein [Cucumispora dikerogammari]|nr:Protein BUD31 like protein [Cucumispora dikerogammari]
MNEDDFIEEFKSNDKFSSRERELAFEIKAIKNQMLNIICDTKYTINRLEKPGNILKLHFSLNRLIFDAEKSKLISKEFKKMLIKNDLIDFHLQKLWKSEKTKNICCVLCNKSACPCGYKEVSFNCDNCNCGGCM